MASCNDGPSTYSLTMYGVSPCMSASSTTAVHARGTRLAASNSRANRRRAGESYDAPAHRILMATRPPPGRCAR
ncbi:hypothetical protein AB0M44_14060 [Streptosporangium subroseum]|uniref:hypothetical protein n=1 Tax=Streptosporangium subroseum TaxID=106412 RepID=UPI003426BD56